MGPWYIRDPQQPHRPGCSYATLRTLALKKRLDPDTVVRGPSTRQFWTHAKRTPGLAHLLGACHACKKPAQPDDVTCVSCGVSFIVSDDRQTLGLADVRLLPGRASPEQIAKLAASGKQPPAIRPTPSAIAAQAASPVSPVTSTTSTRPTSPALSVNPGPVVVEAQTELHPVELAPAHASASAAAQPRTPYDDATFVASTAQRPKRIDPDHEPGAYVRGRAVFFTFAALALVAMLISGVAYASIVRQGIAAGRANAASQTAPAPTSTAP